MPSNESTPKALPNFAIQREPGRLVLSGGLNADAPRGTWDFLLKLGPSDRLVIDAANLEGLDLNGAAQLLWATDAAKSLGAELTVAAMPETLTPIWNLARETLDKTRPSPKPKRLTLVQETGLAVVSLWEDCLGIMAFLGETIFHVAGLFRRPWTGRWSMVLKIVESAVVNALPVTALVAFLVGLILAFQSAMFMRMFGVDIFVADLVGLAMIRELGSLMTAIVLTGRTGSAFSAELGSMKTNQEIDAFVTLGLSPVRDLALPRILALTAATPCLAVLANLAGLLGGNLVMISLGYPVRVFWDELGSHVDASDISTGLFKALVFGFVVAAVGCQRGLAAGDGPEAVGLSTTKGVVTNIIFVAFLDSLFAVIFYVLNW